MIGKRGLWPTLHLHLLLKQRIAAAAVLLVVLGLQCFDLHAELLFRSVEQVNGQQHWSPIKKYGNPSDTTYAEDATRGAAAAAEEVRVFLSGKITHQDVDSAEVMANLVKNGKQKIAGNTVWLASHGGDIDAGMELGRLLRKWGVFTFIAKNDQCLSACVFAFMGGERRSVAGRLGIHRPFFPFTQDTPDRPAQFRHLEKTLKDFIEELDFPASLYEAVMLVPPESMQIVSSADLKRYFLEGISPSTEDRVDAASARRLNISMFEYLQRKAKAPACTFLDAGQGRCEGKVQESSASDGVADDAAGTMADGETAPAGSAAGHATGEYTSPLHFPRDTTRNAGGPS